MKFECSCVSIRLAAISVSLAKTESIALTTQKHTHTFQNEWNKWWLIVSLSLIYIRVCFNNTTCSICNLSMNKREDDLWLQNCVCVSVSVGASVSERARIQRIYETNATTAHICIYSNVDFVVIVYCYCCCCCCCCCLKKLHALYVYMLRYYRMVRTNKSSSRSSSKKTKNKKKYEEERTNMHRRCRRRRRRRRKVH